MPRRHHGTPSDDALPQPPLVEMVFLGTASMVSSPTRHVSGIGVAIGGDCWIFDAGEGTGTQLAKSSVLQSAVSRVFVTHMHGDHVFGLMGLLLSVGCSGDPRIIQVVGPPGLRRYLRRNLADTESSMLCQYRVDELWFGHTSIGDSSDADALYEPTELPGLNVLPLEDGTWRIPPPPSTGKLHPRHQHTDEHGHVEETFHVRAAPLKHSLEPCYAFVIQERDYPGRVHLTSDLKARLLQHDNQKFLQGCGISNPLAVLTKLQHGHSVELVDGVLAPGDVISERRTGRRLVILGDTCDSRAVARLAVGADVVVHECTNAFVDALDGAHSTFDEVEATTYIHGHSTPRTAGRFAQAVQCRHLILTHFSRRYKDDGSMESVMESILRQCAAHYGAGKIECAHDLEVVTIKIAKDARYSDADQAYRDAETAADDAKAHARAFYLAQDPTLSQLSRRTRRLLE